MRRGRRPRWSVSPKHTPGSLQALNIRFHRHLPVVPFGEDIRQPNHRRPAPAEPPLLMVPGNLSVQDLDKAHLDHLPDKQSHIIYPFRDDHQIALSQEILDLLRELHSHYALLSQDRAAWERA